METKEKHDELSLEASAEVSDGQKSEQPVKKPFKESAMLFLKFTVFSLGAGIIQVVSFTLLNELAGLDYWVSTIIALALSVVYNFTVNRKFTFKSAANVPKAMALAFLFYVPFTPYQYFGTKFLTATHGWNEYLVLLIFIIQNFILEFLWCRYVVYRNNINNVQEKKQDKKDN